jgi:hypothetical protein
MTLIFAAQAASDNKGPPGVLQTFPSRADLQVGQESVPADDLRHVRFERRVCIQACWCALVHFPVLREIEEAFEDPRAHA